MQLLTTPWLLLVSSAKLCYAVVGKLGAGLSSTISRTPCLSSFSRVGSLLYHMYLLTWLC
jgi:hypothetical protein